MAVEPLLQSLDKAMEVWDEGRRETASNEASFAKNLILCAGFSAGALGGTGVDLPGRVNGRYSTRGAETNQAVGFHVVFLFQWDTPCPKSSFSNPSCKPKQWQPLVFKRQTQELWREDPLLPSRWAAWVELQARGNRGWQAMTCPFSADIWSVVTEVNPLTFHGNFVAGGQTQ